MNHPFTIQKSNEKRAATWNSIASIAETGDARPWVHRVAKYSLTSLSGVSLPDQTFADTLTSMDGQTMRRVVVALAAAKNHYQATTDVLGTVGIPFFLGFIAIITLDQPDTLVSLYLGILFAYIVWYLITRFYCAAATTAFEALEVLEPRALRETSNDAA